jgi:hypothetical protein
MRRRIVILSSIAALLVLCVLVAPSATGAPRAQNRADLTATGKSLVTQFFTLVQKKDATGLEKFLSPAFQLQRADGSGTGKADYLQSLPTVTGFELTKFSATQTGSVLVVRYLATATGVVNGKPYTPGPAPRLSVFSRSGKRWQLVAHANFNPLNG